MDSHHGKPIVFAYQASEYDNGKLVHGYKSDMVTKIYYLLD